MKALLVIDLQNDFGPKGALSVPGAETLVSPVNTLMRSFSLVIATQDWHPKGHKSFVIWPDHCIEKSVGADFLPGLETRQFNQVIRKGSDESVDGYSAFVKTELASFLKRRDVDHLYVSGVATEYCILYTVLDALSLGYRTTVVLDACRGIEKHPGDVAAALEQMQKKGAEFAFVEELLHLIGEINE